MTDLPQETLDAFGGDRLRAITFREKYALRDKDNNIIEKTPNQMWHRLAREISMGDEYEGRFYSLLEDYKFIPGGRIMFGAGLERNATLLNCYVIPIEDDSLDGIFDWCHKAAKTYSYGGGVGGDISILRPKGSSVSNCAITSTGAVSFMDLMSMVTGTIGQSGRRGALMITIDVTHPDIEDFINIKNDDSRTTVQFANISVKITDDFMNKLENNEDIELTYDGEVYGTISTTKLWGEIIKNAHASAEPGVMFWDRMVQGSPTEYNGMNVITTNPCGEQPLDPYSNCCLGSINLSKYVLNEFEEDSEFDTVNFVNDIYTAVRFLDNIITYNTHKHPLDEQSIASSHSRRIGLGATGLGDMLIKLGIKYDTDQALEIVDTIFETLRNTAYYASSDLAKEKGVFKAYDYDEHSQGEFFNCLPSEIKSVIAKNGLRNACILTIPPVGSGSILAGCTSGIEPVFALSYQRRSESLSEGTYEVRHPLYAKYIEKYGENDLPDYFRVAHEISPDFRVRMQATIQRYIDSSISSTVNLPEDITLKEVDQIYRLAWKLGCKGITVYREGSRDGILQTKPISEEKEKSVNSELSRPMVLDGKTYRIKTGHGNLYLTVNTIDGKPVEIFVNIGKSGLSTTADAEALGRVISLALRTGAPLHEVISQLQDIGGNRQVYAEGALIKSVPDAIAKILEKHYTSEEVVGQGKLVLDTTENPDIILSTDDYLEVPDFCKNPGYCVVEISGGCVTCKYCGESKCD